MRSGRCSTTAKIRPVRPPPHRLLVVKLASLGDLLTITPALRALRTSFPTAHIGVLTTPGSAPVLRGLDSFDEVIIFDKFAFDRPANAMHGLPRALALARDLRAGRWDTLVLLHHLTTAFGIAKYAGLSLFSGASRRVGLDNGRGGWFLTQSSVDRGFGWRHETEYWLDVVRVLGARHPGKPRLELCIAPDDDAWAAARWGEMDLRDGAVLLAPGSGAFSRARRWSPARFAAVGAALFEALGLTPIVLSGLDADEQILARKVAAEIGPAARVAPPAPGPQALGALLRRCRVVIANDGGVVHVATTVRTPIVAIFGPTNDRAWGPYPPGDPRHQVVREALACAPCTHRGHDFGTPQGCPARTCLALVEVAAVIAAAERAVGAATPLAARA
jgi:ADP-heptose:LPS heptosyltransferase